MEHERLNAEEPELDLKSSLEPAGGGLLIVPPLFDVFFLLLMLFVLGSFVFKGPGLEIRLPTVPPERSAVGEADKVVISVTREGQIYFIDKLVPGYADLEDEIRDLIKKDSRPPTILLRVDEELPYREAVNIMSIAQQNGAHVYLVTTEGMPK